MTARTIGAVRRSLTGASRHAWLDPITAIGVARGIPHDEARAQARLGVAVTRGLLLDLLATGDVAGVDAAMEAFIQLNEAWLAGLEAPAPGRFPTTS